MDKLPGFKRRMNWFIQHRPDLCGNIASLTRPGMNRAVAALHGASFAASAHSANHARRDSSFSRRMVSAASRATTKIIRYFACRRTGLSRELRSRRIDHRNIRGNSNWRGPVWFPVNYLMIESLQRYHHYFGNDFQVECPTGSGVMMNLADVAAVLSRRLSRLFLRDEHGRRPAFRTWRKIPDRSAFPRPHPVLRVFQWRDGAGLAPATRRAGRRW